MYLKVLLHETIFSATCNAMLMTTKHCKLLENVRRLQPFLQLVTQLIRCLDKSVWVNAKTQFWLALSPPCAIIVTVRCKVGRSGHVTHCNWLRNTAKSRLNFFCNLIRNFSLCYKLQRGVICVTSSATCLAMAMHCRLQRKLPRVITAP